ncbi:hypothetical protein [Flavobacterium sp. GT3P67]|uniref:hypothetical protein n=1 Tax=Flavobacterium sp. GT3P67 TaxID=2541722 RepID=UPI0010481B29|nr:hypothetical protein [Flavobacterium sp. GT3P67]TDE53794.1 hypothetical protein E0H99_07190 [Flavobacterium sp. GT3P67]
MNRLQRIAFIKRESRELETQEALFRQGLSSITSRKRYLELELASLGASNSTRKGKYDDVLTDQQKLEIRASLTK